MAGDGVRANHRARMCKLFVWLCGIYVFGACAVICRKAKVALLEANYLSSRYQIPLFPSTKSAFLCAFSL